MGFAQFAHITNFYTLLISPVIIQFLFIDCLSHKVFFGFDSNNPSHSARVVVNYETERGLGLVGWKAKDATENWWEN
jgi:hypothetical protein